MPGLIWQFALVAILLYREVGNVRWSTLKERPWLGAPRSPKTGQPRKLLWWWLLPLIVLKALDSMALPEIVNVDAIWVKIFPFFAEPPGFSFSGFLGSEAGKASMIGRWDLFILFLVMAVFNTFIGEELLFRCAWFGIVLHSGQSVFFMFLMLGLVLGLA